jgi:hypothetical protein
MTVGHSSANCGRCDHLPFKGLFLCIWNFRGLSMIWWQQFRERLIFHRGQPALDALLSNALPAQSLGERVAWAQDLL